MIRHHHRLLALKSLLLFIINYCTVQVCLSNYERLGCNGAEMPAETTKRNHQALVGRKPQRECFSSNIVMIRRENGVMKTRIFTPSETNWLLEAAKTTSPKQFDEMVSKCLDSASDSIVVLRQEAAKNMATQIR